MVESPRKIHIYFGEAGSQDESKQKIRSYLFNSSAGGETMPSEKYQAIFDDNIDGGLESSLEFDEKTGEFVKNEGWDDTYIIIDYTQVLQDAAIQGAMEGKDIDYETQELIRKGTEEAIHALQDYVSASRTKTDKKTGNYIEPTKGNDGEDGWKQYEYPNSYEEHDTNKHLKHEVKAKQGAEKAVKEFRKK